MTTPALPLIKAPLTPLLTQMTKALPDNGLAKTAEAVSPHLVTDGMGARDWATFSMTNTIHTKGFWPEWVKLIPSLTYTVNMVKNKHGKLVLLKSAFGHPIASGMVTPAKHMLPAFPNAAKTAIITDVMVGAGERNSGHAKQIMQQLTQHASSMGVDRLVLDTKNPVAMRLYERLGYTVLSPKTPEWQYYQQLLGVNEMATRVLMSKPTTPALLKPSQLNA
jgi:ribosomal protein S18 acetylase RimI-like enzyme